MKNKCNKLQNQIYCRIERIQLLQNSINNEAVVQYFVELAKIIKALMMYERISLNLTNLTNSQWNSVSKVKTIQFCKNFHSFKYSM